MRADRRSGQSRDLRKGRQLRDPWRFRRNLGNGGAGQEALRDLRSEELSPILFGGSYSAALRCSPAALEKMAPMTPPLISGSSTPIMMIETGAQRDWIHIAGCQSCSVKSTPAITIWPTRKTVK